MTLWFTNVFICSKQCTFRKQKLQGQGMGKNLEAIPAWQQEKVKSKKEAVLEEQRQKRKSSLLH